MPASLEVPRHVLRVRSASCLHDCDMFELRRAGIGNDEKKQDKKRRQAQMSARNGQRPVSGQCGGCREQPREQMSRLAHFQAVRCGQIQRAAPPRQHSDVDLRRAVAVSAKSRSGRERIQELLALVVRRIRGSGCEFLNDDPLEPVHA